MLFQAKIYPFNNSAAMKKYSAIIPLCKKDCVSNALLPWICVSLMNVISL